MCWISMTLIDLDPTAVTASTPSLTPYFINAQSKKMKDNIESIQRTGEGRLQSLSVSIIMIYSFIFHS